MFEKLGLNCKGIVCFMIEGMKEFIPCDQVISRNNNTAWFRDELFECLNAHIESQWKKILFHILNSFESFTCQEHKGKQQKYTNRAVINIYFNNKRKLSTDSVMKHKVKTFRKDKEESNSIWRKSTQGNFVSEMQNMFFGSNHWNLFWKIGAMKSTVKIVERYCDGVQI